ncbi:sulfotransferase domain-containing protein [Francisella sp. XLW-1]|uniref:sulfotransferase domain-containing protein n=1 Tax=Francisella sp. XLW-1 TaxID=2610887 RepID=UPI00123CC60B|nr:sulfotransferase domain-containing protein [Francisella sp. XLW-1]
MYLKEEIYVIGFPKSGNTWLSRLMADITNSNIYVESDNDFINSSENSSGKTGDFIIHKIHVANDLCKVLESKKIYILRDPRAVFVSAFFHNFRSLQERNINKSFLMRLLFNFEIANVNKAWNKTVLARINDFKNRSGAMKVGNWSNHVEFWSNQKDICIVRYEDLLENTQVVMERILQELGINYSKNKLESVIERQSFKIKKEEFMQKNDRQNASFLRSGEKEDWKKYLSQKQIKTIEKVHYKMMDAFSYERMF